MTDRKTDDKIMKVLIATQKPFAKAAVDSIKEVIANAGFEPVMKNMPVQTTLKRREPMPTP